MHVQRRATSNESAAVPSRPKIYHIVHTDRLSSITAAKCLWSDSEMERRSNRSTGTSIGISEIKKSRRVTPLPSYSDLHVGDCVPFYFCPRSVMLYLLYKGNHASLTYSDGQDHIIHLEADLKKTVSWAQRTKRRWVFTLQNAAKSGFEDRNDLSDLGDVDWHAVQAKRWTDCKDGKQAEFLIEERFPWTLVTRIGVLSGTVCRTVSLAIQKSDHKPVVEVRPEWYYPSHVSS